MTLGDADVEEGASLRNIRRAVRRLPRERRRDVLAAIRAGREVRDPRDAGLAIASADCLERIRWPAWVMPRSRPHGRRALVWLIYAGFLFATTVTTLVILWSIIPGVWRWVVIGVYIYSVLTSPLTTARVLRTYWNAPQAAERNRQLLGRQH